MNHKPPETPASTPPTTRRAEVEQARRTAPVQAYRARLRAPDLDDQTIRMLAEAVRRLLRRP